MELSFALLAISVAVAAAVIFVAMPYIGMPGATTLFLRFSAVSGVCAVGSSAMYFVYSAGGGIVALVMGDVAMVLAPSLLFVAVSSLGGRRPRRASVVALALVVMVATVTATVPQPASLGVKALVLSGACAACAWIAHRCRVEPSAPLRVIAIVTAVYASYSLARVVVGLGLGWSSAVYVSAFSFGPTTVLGALAVLLIGLAVVRVRFGPRAAVGAAPHPSGVGVVVGDWDLASTAYGLDRMRALVAELRAAARELDQAAVDVPRGVQVGIPDASQRIGDLLRRAYGWKADEVVLLVEDAAAGARGGRLGAPGTGPDRDSPRT